MLLSLHAMIRNQACYRSVLLLGVLGALCVAADAQQYPLYYHFQCDSVLSVYVSEWRSVFVEVTNQSDQLVRVVPRAVFSKEGRLLARTAIPHQQLWTLVPGGTVRIDGAALFGQLVGQADPLGSHRHWQPLSDTGMITFCIHLTDSMGIEYLALPQCRTIRVVRYQLPVPLWPIGDEQLVLQRGRRASIRFAWMPILPLRSRTCYILRCFPLPDSLSNAEAVRIQSPLFEQRVCDTAHYVWKRTSRLQPGRYIWTVQALDQTSDLPIGSSDGYSVPATFIVTMPQLHSVPSHHWRRK